MFIKLTNLEDINDFIGEEVYINASKISFIKKEDFCTLVAADKHIFYISETPEEILEMIGRIENERNRNGN